MFFPLLFVLFENFLFFSCVDWKLHLWARCQVTIDIFNNTDGSLIESGRSFREAGLLSVCLSCLTYLLCVNMYTVF